MEAEFRKDQAEKSKDIARLSQDILVLKTTMIGIDGKSGMRDQITSLSKDVSSLKDSIDGYLKTVYDLKTQEAKFELLFSTKEELRQLDSKISNQLFDMNSKLEEDFEKRDRHRESQEHYSEKISISKKGLYISLIGIIASIILGFIY